MTITLTSAVVSVWGQRICAGQWTGTTHIENFGEASDYESLRALIGKAREKVASFAERVDYRDLHVRVTYRSSALELDHFEPTEERDVDRPAMDAAHILIDGLIVLPI